jgi:uncharacterized integral membrane protein (TIGR00698 family)
MSEQGKPEALEVAGTEVRPAGLWQVCCAGVSCTLPGLGACVALAAVAHGLGRLVPLVGGPVFAILLGIIVGNTLGVKTLARPGIAFCSKRVLQYAIVLLGGSLSLLEVWRTGRESAAVMLLTLAVALLAAYVLGRLLRVDRKLTSLVGVGTGICGGSAIAAIAPIIAADDDEIAFSISTVFLFNVIAVLIFPLAGHLLGLTDAGFGIWAGTAINDTSSVVAAAYSYSHEAGDIATITKLARTAMIVPIALGFSLLVARRQPGVRHDLRRTIPWFILFFLLLALLNTLGLFGPSVASGLGQGGKLLITVALAGVGLGANFRKMVRTGPRPILLGLAVWVCVALSSLVVQSLLRQV